jgi:hypothetical protein
MLTLLVGDPGVGKSLLTILLAAQVSREGHNVLLLSAEDHPGATIRPRAEAADADLDRLHVVGMRRDGYEDGIALPDDAAALDSLVAAHDARLVIVDPLMAHLQESVNSWRDQSVRRALAPLHKLAEDRHCAVVVVAHLNKGQGVDPLYRTGGSIGITAAVRSALLLARDPSDPEGDRGGRRVLAHHKSNVSELSESVLCRVEAVEKTAVLRVVGTSEFGAGELLAMPAGTARKTKREQAADLLRDILRDGPRLTTDIKAAAEAAGIGWRTVEDAKSDLGIKAGKEDGRSDGKWAWSLPEADEGRKATISDLAVFAGSASESGSDEPIIIEGRKAAKEAADPRELTAPQDGLPPCRYNHHRPSDYTGLGGGQVCGVCHPQPGTAT